MNGIDEEVRDALEVWRHDGQEPDWDDVLVRARAARPRPRREARRLRAALALVVLAGLAVLATPALGISQRLGTFVGLRSAAKPGLVLTATLKSAAAQGTARLTLETSRVGIAARTGGRNAVPFVPVSPGRLLQTQCRPLAVDVHRHLRPGARRDAVVRRAGKAGRRPDALRSV